MPTRQYIHHFNLVTIGWIIMLTGASAAGNAAELPSELQTAPRYDRSMWLAHSLATADLVVAGTPRIIAAGENDSVESARLDVAEVLYGKIHPSLRLGDDGLKLIPPYRFKWDSSGLWILLRTPDGCFSMNPSDAPLDRSRWNRLAKTLAKRDASHPPLSEHATESGQLYRTYRNEMTQEEVWHGTNVWRHDGIYTELLKDGKRVFFRFWDAHGRLDSVRQIADKGYFLDYHQGKLFRFGHYRGGKREGVSRTFYREKPSQVKEEIHWRNGIQYGISRKWDVSGKPALEERYDEGFIAPVTRYRGTEPSRCKLHKSEFGVGYSAPRDVADALEVGMTTAEVSELLKLDFSERSGIHFPFYNRDTFLKICFQNGRISERKTGPNGTHWKPRE